MSDTSQGAGWWMASDQKWYPPHLHPDVLSRQPPPPANWTPGATKPVEPVPQRWDNPVNPQQGGATPYQPVGAAPEVFEQVSVAAPNRAFTRVLPFTLVSLVVLAGVGFLVASFLGRDDNSTLGGSSPEAAFDQMIAAMANEDVVGMVSMLDPVEAAGLVDALRQLEGDGLDLHGLPGGLDLRVSGIGADAPAATFSPLGGDDSGLVVAEMDGVALTLARTGDDDAAWLVDIGGQLMALSIDEIDIGSEVVVELEPVRGGIEARSRADVNGERVEEQTDFVDNVPLEMVFIETDGRWYVSITYSITNMIVEVLDVEPPEYGRWRQVLDSGTGGGESPTAAVENMVNAAAALDLEATVNTMDPVELRLLYDFVPVIEREARSELDRARDAVAVDVIDLALSTGAVSGDTTEVIVDHIVVEITGQGPDEFLRFEGSGDWCGSFESAGQAVSGCIDEALDQLESEFAGEFGEFGLDFALRELLPDSPVLITTQRQGRWYVSPLATITDYGRHIGPLLENAATDIQGQAGVTDTGAGMTPAEQVAFGADVRVEVPAGGTAGFVITPAGDGYGEATFMGSVSFDQVEVESTGDALLRHDVENYWDDLSDDTLSLRAGETTSLVLAAQEYGPTRSHGFLVENTGGETITVTVRATHLEFVEASGGTASGTLGDDPVVVVADGFSDARATGALLVSPDEGRSPWSALADAGDRGSFAPYLIVVGEPGSAFQISADG